jgi:general secretion pathway protein D
MQIFKIKLFILLFILLFIIPLKAEEEAKNSLNSQVPKESESDMVQLDFDNVDVSEVAKNISELSGIKIVIGEDVKGTVTIHTTKKIPVKEAFNMFLKAIELNGLTAINRGDFYEIVQLPKEKKIATQVEEKEKVKSPSKSFPRSESKMVVLNFDNADVVEVARTVSEISGINIVVSPNVKGAVTIHTTKKIPAEEIFNIFLTVLELNGLTAIKREGFYEIVPLPSAKQRPIEIKVGQESKEVEKVDKVITQIIPIENIPAKEIETVIKPLLSPTANVTFYPRRNILILTELSSNIKRVLEIVRALDINIFKDLKIRLFKIKYIDPEELSKELTNLFSMVIKVGGKREELKLSPLIMPIPRAGSILIASFSPQTLETAQNWITILDQPITEAAQGNYVYHVKHGKASNLANVLNQLFQKKKGVKNIKAISQTTTSTTSLTPPKKGEKLKQPEAKVSVTKGGTVIEIPHLGGVPPLIVADDSTNSLIIRTSYSQYIAIKRLLDQLDIRPLQVLIEMFIAEVVLKDDLKYGLQWALMGQDRLKIGGEIDQVESRARTYFGISEVGTGAPAAQGFSYLLTSAGRFTLLLRTLISKGRANVLSTPHILVKNNSEASINVGEEVPIITTQQTSQIQTGGSSNILQNIEYRSTGVILKVTPHINEEGSVVLDINQEVSQVTSLTTGGIQSPTFGKREAKTSVLAQDGQTLVIGGLIQERRSQNYRGIPVLSSIPILGALFRDTQTITDKTELIILMTPHIVRNPTEADKITEDFKNKIKELKKSLTDIKKKEGKEK